MLLLRRCSPLAVVLVTLLLFCGWTAALQTPGEQAMAAGASRIGASSTSRGARRTLKRGRVRARATKRGRAPGTAQTPSAARGQTTGQQAPLGPGESIVGTPTGAALFVNVPPQPYRAPDNAGAFKTNYLFEYAWNHPEALRTFQAGSVTGAPQQSSLTGPVVHLGASALAGPGQSFGFSQQQARSGLLGRRDRNGFALPVTPNPPRPYSRFRLPRTGLVPYGELLGPAPRPARPAPETPGPQVQWYPRSPCFAGFQCCIGRIQRGASLYLPVFLDQRLGHAYVIYAQDPSTGVRGTEIPVWIFWSSNGRVRYMKGSKFFVLFDDDGYLVRTNQTARQSRLDLTPVFCNVPDLLNLPPQEQAALRRGARPGSRLVPQAPLPPAGPVRPPAPGR